MYVPSKLRLAEFRIGTGEQDPFMPGQIDREGWCQGPPVLTAEKEKAEDFAQGLLRFGRRAIQGRGNLVGEDWMRGK